MRSWTTVRGLPSDKPSSLISSHSQCLLRSSCSLHWYRLTILPPAAPSPDIILTPGLIESLFTRYPTATPGSLTIMRHSRHGDSSLAAFCVISGLVDQLLDLPSEIMTGLQRYKRDVNAEKTAADRCAEGAGRWEFWANIPLCGVSMI